MLLVTVAELQTESLAVIVEDVYRTLSAATKKNAIEAKVCEVIAKSRDATGSGAKGWVVRPEVRVSAAFCAVLSSCWVAGAAAHKGVGMLEDS